MRAPHEVLGIQDGATRAEIDEAYRRKLLYLNPNAFAEETPERKNAIKAYEEIKEAYAALISPQQPQATTASAVQYMPAIQEDRGLKAIEMLKLTLRWIAVLPGSFIGAYIAYWICKFLRSDWSNRSFLGAIVLFTTECVASGIFGAIFIYAGSRIAPSYKKQTTIALAIIGVAILGASAFATLVTHDYKVIIFIICTGVGGGLSVWEAFDKA